MRDLLCFARGHAGEWEGICLDFDLAVQGRSFDDIRRALEDAVADYVAAARDEDDATRDRLLSRRAPAWVAFAWTARVLWSAWRRDASDGDTSATFPVACPA
ncbi:MULTISPECIES: hypothetical protein [Methylosinus]|uniref:DUF1902 domain-containing protein n=1 Tax=Methylosinus trichosporium (strain ATCC 35070 / NCIMB 11131 / UNIQEM 75 / OB3b) TaxID=595536 RepID=A0A2D2CX74_METT3|nr:MULTISPECIES: hypothetical protein [Methylosinus]ATQ67347.1 hypothetical protein CQW49_05155 [Methylosinus trichosporium OB3b]OBS51639.1 hypothetical protein A8B73_15625 [Methylosinus sp. 3S-1]